MSRKNLFCIFASLLWLLPTLTHAQSLVQYEYWFDNDVSGRQPVIISGTDVIINTHISTEGLSPGLHKFNFRVRRSDGEYSPVTSSMFFKGTAQGKRLEYWFDDDIGSRDHIDISDTEEEQTFDLNLCDISKFPMGFHQFNMRVAMGGYSPVYSASVLKLSSGAPTKIEYWVDDDYAHRQWVTGHPSASGDKDYVYVDPFDLRNVGPGLHRIYYRATSENGITSSPVSMTPVFVKSRYSTSDGSSVGGVDAQVTQYSIAVDNEEPVMRKFGSTDYDVTLDDDFDMHDLAPGTHTVKMSFWNSLGAGVSLQKQFTKIVPEIPAPTLTATEKDGIVQLHYDIPANQYAYRLMRKDANGAKAEIKRRKTYRGYEESGSYTDTPAAGSYTYYVESSYYDSNGSTHKLTSNEMSFTIAQAQSELNNCGYITGFIYPKYGAAPRHDIIYSDGVEKTIEDRYFERQMIPAGTELTISVRGNSKEKFETVTITIKPGENRVTLEDLSKPIPSEPTPNYFTNDLQFSSDLEWIGSNYQFSVKNVTRNTWSGYVRLRIIAKNKAMIDKFKDGSEATDPSEEEEYDEITPGLRAEDNYIYVTSEEIKNLQSGKSTMVSLSLDNVFPPDKKDWYYIYFESIGKWNSDPKGSEEVKDIGIDRDFNITENPILRKIDKSSLAKAQEKVQEQRIENYANLLVACCSRLNQLNGIIGNLGDGGWVEQIHKCKEKYPIDLMDLNQYLDDVIETESAEDYEENLMMQAFFNEVFGTLGFSPLELANTFRDDIANDIFKYSKGVEDYFGKAMKCLKYIKRYRTWERMNDYDKFFYAADAILDVADRYTDTPICEMFKVYSKVGRSLAQKAHELGEEYYEYYAPSELKGNVDTENKFAYNVNVDFKIMVIPDCWYSFLYFNFEKNGTEPIREVVVKVHNHPSFENEVATLLFDIVPVSDGVMLKQTSILDANALEDGYPINRMWMEIKWKNGRTTKVPLRADIDGVELGDSPHNATVKQYTVYLKSATDKFANMADKIEIKE